MKRVLAKNVRVLTVAVVAGSARLEAIAGKTVCLWFLGEAACFPNDGMLTASPTVQPVVEGRNAHNEF